MLSFGILLLIILLIVYGTSIRKYHPAIVLLTATLIAGFLMTPEPGSVPALITEGFGNIMGHIGLIVVLGSVMGSILEHSGTASGIAEWILRKLGKRPGTASVLLGGTIGIPVFCDSGFIILSSLTKNLALKAGRNPASSLMALSAGLYATHTLIPPTPGPIAAAGNLGATDHLGMIIIFGVIVSIPTLICAYLFAGFSGKKIEVPVEAVDEELAGARKDILLMTSPILVPVVLIALLSVLRFTGAEVPVIVTLIGSPVIALFTGVLLSLLLVARKDYKNITTWISEGISRSGPILVLTGLGGSFGNILKNSGLMEAIQEISAPEDSSGMILLITAFLLASLLKTAQGSSTTALVITSSLMMTIIPGTVLEDPTGLAFTVLAIGSGSMAVSHANDSYFWVVSQFSGFSISQAYRGYSFMTFLMGVTGLATILLLYMFIS